MRALSNAFRKLWACKTATVVCWALTTACMFAAARGRAQTQAYIGYVYPAGGQAGTNITVRLGGQGLEEVKGAIVTGNGVSAVVVENYRRLNNQEMQLLNEQVAVLKRETMTAEAKAMLVSDSGQMMSAAEHSDDVAGSESKAPDTGNRGDAIRKQIEKIERRTFEFVQNPASMAIGSVVILEVRVGADATPGEREIRLVTARGISNPLPFHIGSIPEHTKKAMIPSAKQVLGKEAQALRRRGMDETEARIELPCTVNGQISSGEISRYWFKAKKGQKLVISVQARELVPFIADAVPGWFQPVLTVYDKQGREVAYVDDFYFKPDPAVLFDVPEDGEYMFAIRDSLYRGREDFVYRISAGELPFVTSVFPLGKRAGSDTRPQVRGWNLKNDNMELACSCAVCAEIESNNAQPLDASAISAPGIHMLQPKTQPLASGALRFAVSDLPESTEANDSAQKAQAVEMPCVINGRIERPGQVDVYEFSGKSNGVVVLEVLARRLDSPLDSVLRVTDATGALLGFNDDTEDLGAGIQTHHADSYLRVTLPKDGAYYAHLTDTARSGGDAFAYRLRISEPQPRFELRVTPSNLNLRSRSSGGLNVHAIRRDGFAGPIQVSLKDSAAGFSAQPITMAATQTVARLNIKTRLDATDEPVDLVVRGRAKWEERTLESIATPAEDKMQAFLWRHLVPARDLKAVVFDPVAQPAPRRMAKLRAAAAKSQSATASAENTSVAGTNGLNATNTAVSTNIAAVGTNSVIGTNTVAGTNVASNQPKFTKQQVQGRLRMLGMLFQEGMLTDEFYAEKVVELETAE